MNKKYKKYKEYWIRQGTNNFTYEFWDEPGEEPIESLEKGDQFYDVVFSRPIKGGMHVVQIEAYNEIQAKLERLTMAVGNFCDMVRHTQATSFADPLIHDEVNAHRKRLEKIIQGQRK